MIVKLKMKTDLMNQTTCPVVSVPQNDGDCRVLELELFAGGEPWHVPEGTSVRLHYIKADGTGGAYDTLEDGSAAWSVNGNLLTISLVPQMFSVEGNLAAKVEFLQGEKRLNTFAFWIRVAHDCTTDAVEAEDYFNWSDWTNQELKRMLSEAESSGMFAGERGEQGVPGYTPVKGVDYYTDAEKAEWGSYIGVELAKRGQLKPEFAETIEECTDPEKIYVLPDGYLYAHMKHTEEVVIPGETVTIPAKAVIIHGQRYSFSGKAWGAKEGCASLIFPVEFESRVPKESPVTLTLVNALRHASYTGALHGVDPVTAFTTECVQNAVNSGFVSSTIYGIPAGKGFLVINLRTSTTDGSDLANVSFTFNGETFVPELYFDAADASKAAHATTTVLPDTIETVESDSFVCTGHAFVPADYENRILALEQKVANMPAMEGQKSKSIVMNNSTQALTSSIAMTVPQLKKNKTLAFSGTYNGSLTEISIVQGEGSGFTECKCVVTATTITISKNSASVYTAEHGLTFGTHFSLVLATKNGNKTKVYLTSDGKTFTTAEFVWNSSKSSVKLYTNVPFTQYQLSFGSSDFDRAIWMYGDSYFDHWLPVSINRGYTNCLADGYSGGGSSAGLTSFRLAMEHGTPKKVVWCLGMNDGDSGAINTSWLNAITAVKQICDENNVELWVTTIPNVPSINHTYKNAYIRENFKYIDISKYVGAEESTAWYTGLLSSDNVHPSTEGDFYIANIMESYFPEMMDV